jgi:hypothetical protein
VTESFLADAVARRGLELEEGQPSEMNGLSFIWLRELLAALKEGRRFE